MPCNLPNFLIVGAAKCGTTSVHNYLKQHPQIYMPAHKEPLFMVSEIYEKLSPKDPRYKISEAHTVFSFDEYKNLFKAVENEKVIGESSTPYLYYYKRSIPKIKKYLGDVHILICLRNPVDRAYSSYNHSARDTEEKCSFEEFLAKEEERKTENWDILNFPKGLGFYYDQVTAFQDNFSHVKICLAEDLKIKTVKTIQDICSFLDVDSSFEPDVKMKHNKSQPPGSYFLHRLLSKDNILKDIGRPVLRAIFSQERVSRMSTHLRNKNEKKMKPKTYEYLQGLYREDILKLQWLIGRNLSDWLQ